MAMPVSTMQRMLARVRARLARPRRAASMAWPWNESRVQVWLSGVQVSGLGFAQFDFHVTVEFRFILCAVYLFFTVISFVGCEIVTAGILQMVFYMQTPIANKAAY